MAALRDTIIITKVSDGYQVNNRKWKKNEFDQEGWVKQEHDAVKPYRGNFDESTRTLNSEPVGLFPILQFDTEAKHLRKGEGKIVYKRPML